MPSICLGFKYLITNRSEFCDSFVKNFLGFIPDKPYLSLRYRCKVGKWIDWDNPRTFSEKIQWLKIYDRKPEYTIMVDKYAVKNYVSGIIGQEFIIPTLGVWDNPDLIDWDALPNQFVLKTTHGGGSGGVIICKDYSSFNKETAILKLNQSLSSDIYNNYREWPYKDVPKKILAERYIAPSNRDSIDLPDYKFFCFNGEPKYCQVIRDRHTKETIDFYDMKWRHQEFVGLNPIASNGLNPVTKPKHLNTMIEICRKLSCGIPFIRVDLYVVDNRVYFGELTFYPASGFGTITPDQWQYRLGNLIQLPSR